MDMDIRGCGERTVPPIFHLLVGVLHGTLCPSLSPIFPPVVDRSCLRWHAVLVAPRWSQTRWPLWPLHVQLEECVLMQTCDDLCSILGGFWITPS